MSIDFGGLLQQYLGGARSADQGRVVEDFQQIAPAAPPGAVGSGVAEALRSDQTPPFAEMVGQLFGNGNSQQRSGMLNQLIKGLSPALLASLGGGLGSLLTKHAGSAPSITPEVASQLSPEQVQEIAVQAERNDPGIIDRMGEFYASHPTLVKTIGGAALAIVMGKIAERMRA
ncbi:hypothetical protein BH11PSE11_BH11PSE11_20800 [soil metagenome]